MLKIVITDLTVATCDLTGKENIECFQVRLNDGGPEICCVPAELLKLVRLEKRRAASPPSAAKGTQS